MLLHYRKKKNGMISITPAQCGGTSDFCQVLWHLNKYPGLK